MTSQARTDAQRWPGTESGFGLIEVVISAAVLLLVAVGTLSLLDGAQRTSARNTSRSVAANLAEQDQERLRSKRVVELSNYYEQRTVAVSGKEYTVTSDADWLQDATGAPVTCTSSTGQAEYMRITSVAQEKNAATGARPVKLVSLVAPPVGSTATQGTMIVSVKNRSGGPQPGLPVSIVGPQPGTATTNDLGCAVFNYFAVGNYTVNLSVGGFVNPLGLTAVSQSGVIASGAANQATPILYDKPAKIDVSFETRKYGATSFTASSGAHATAANSGIGNATGTFVFGNGTVLPTISATSLFPFSDGYTVYSGDCGAVNDPDTYNSGNYYSSNPGLVMVDPQGQYSVTIRQPSINVTVTKNGSTAVVGGHVKFTSSDSGCTPRTYGPYTTNTQGRISDPGLPSGTYTVCVDDGVVPATNAWKLTRTAVPNKTMAGTTPGGTGYSYTQADAFKITTSSSSSTSGASVKGSWC